MICVSGDEDKEKSGSGQTPSVPELVSIVSVWSPAKPCKDKGGDAAVFKELQDLLDDPTPSGSKDILKESCRSHPKVGMSGKKAGSRSRIRDERIYSYDEIIECQEMLNDSFEFQLNIDDVEKEFRVLLGGENCT